MSESMQVGGRSESGYLHERYAASLGTFGKPQHLCHTGAWILQRAIAGADARDAMGTYPLFCCNDWRALKRDLEEIGEDLVSIVLVTDPFGDYSEPLLRDAFGDLASPYKQHLVADLDQQPESFVSKHHQYYAHKARQRVDIQVTANPPDAADEWCDLYDCLVARHCLSGLQAFSRGAFAMQLSVPGLVMFEARRAGALVSAHLWYLQQDVAYSHLAASNDTAYELMTPYALHWFALHYFTGKVRWIDWGAGAGPSGHTSGLQRFKSGWANATRTSYLCGRIFDREKYNRLSAAVQFVRPGYFPRYRSGELTESRASRPVMTPI